MTQIDLIKKTIPGALGYLYHYKYELVRALFAPIVILLLIGWITPENPTPVFGVLITIVFLVAYLFVVITTHRIILLGPNSVPKWGLFKITKREIWFVIYMFGITIATLPSIILAFIPVIGVIAFGLVSTYLISRFSLILPSIAIDQGLSFSGSWNVTKSNQLLMFVVVGVFPMLLNALIGLISYIPYTDVIVSVLFLLNIVWTIAALSMAFQIIVEAEYKEE